MRLAQQGISSGMLLELKVFVASISSGMKTAAGVCVMSVVLALVAKL